MARLYNGLANVYNDLNNYPSAIENYFKAVKINDQNNFNKNLAGNYNNISQVYKGLDDHVKAKHYLNLSMNFAVKAKDEGLLFTCYFTYAQIYEKEKNYSKAAIYAQKAHKLATEISNENGITSSLFAIGLIQGRQKKFDIAIINISKALKKFIETENEIGTASAYNELGMCYLKKYEQDQNETFLKTAKDNFAKSNEVYKQNDLIDGLSDNYFQLSKIYELENNAQQALTNFKLYTTYKDSIFNGNTKETIKNLEDKRNIELRDKQILINKISLKAKEKQKWFLFSGIALLAIIGSLLFYQNKNRKRTNQKLQILNFNLDQANKTKIRLLSILNHDLRSPVNSFIHYIQFQKENPKVLDEATKSRIENQTLSSAKNLLHSMEDILLWTKDQMDSFEPEFSNVLVSSLFTDTQNHFSSEQNINLKFECPQHLEIFTDKNYLKTIIRNLTGNAIKALSRDCAREEKSATVNWKAWQEKNYTYLSISDNGNGATDEDFSALYDDSLVSATQSGLGLHLIRDLAKIINCKISVESQVDIGTIFELKMQ